MNPPNAPLPVTITLLSRQELDGPEPVITAQSHEGTLAPAAEPGTWYLHYAEEGTTTTLRMSAEKARLYRRGEVSTWQDFDPTAETGGMLELGASALALRVVTSHLSLIVRPGEGHFKLGYDLFGFEHTPDPVRPETPFGTFTLTLSWVVKAAGPDPAGAE